MAEDPFWRSVRLTYEELDEDCPEGHRTVSLAHLASGESIEVNRVRPYRDGWVWIQTDYTEHGISEVNFVRDSAIYRVELKHVRDARMRKSVGFVVEPEPQSNDEP
jgi:hypothetical protein